MTISNSTNGGLDPALLQFLQQKNLSRNIGEQVGTATQAPKPKTTSPKDIVSLSGQETGNQSPSLSGSQGRANGGTRLVSEETQELENGFRRTQEFETGNGKKFTRIEEVTTEDSRSKRLVLQQNESGSTTEIENVIDQQDDGSFRLIQRFTDETGETKTNVQPDYSLAQRDALLGGAPLPTNGVINNSSLPPPRGSQLDLSV